MGYKSEFQQHIGLFWRYFITRNPFLLVLSFPYVQRTIMERWLFYPFQLSLNRLHLPTHVFEYINSQFDSNKNLEWLHNYHIKVLVGL